MQFFKLTHPRYETDHQEARRNRARSHASHHIPGVVCDVCGPWSGSGRVRVPLPAAADELAAIKFLPLSEWRAGRARWAELLGVNESLIEPGVEVGLPHGVCTGTIRENVVHPFPGQIWVDTKVREAFEAARLTGVSLAEVHLDPRCGPVELWEIVVLGRASRIGSTPERLRLCEVCGRRGFPAPRNLAVDETRWDGSDFFFVDENPNIVVVTERVAQVLDSNDFTNIVAQPISVPVR